MKLRPLIVCALLILLGSRSDAQRVWNYFKVLPDEWCFGLSEADRLALFELHRSHPDSTLPGAGLRIEALNAAGGYIRLGGQGDGFWEMTYWAVPDGSILVGVSRATCTDGRCRSEIAFFRDDGDEFLPVEPEKVVPNLGFADFFDRREAKKGKADLKALEAEFSSLERYTFRLPEKGKDVLVRLGVTNWEEAFSPEEAGQLRMALMRPAVVLRWTGSRFGK